MVSAVSTEVWVASAVILWSLVNVLLMTCLALTVTESFRQCFITEVCAQGCVIEVYVEC